MTTESKGIYHWNLGDVALAIMCKKVHTKVRVIKDEKGLFFDDKVLGISGNKDGSLNVVEELCYFVETCRTNVRLWLPYTCMHLTERSRPFYGTEKVSPSKTETELSPKNTPRKRKLQDEHIVPLQVKLNTCKPDFNTAYDTHYVPPKKGKYENAFKEFVRRGRERLFDQYFEVFELNDDKDLHTLKILLNVNASTEDKLDLVVKHMVSEKELDNYLKQCWRYNLVLQKVEGEPETPEILSDVTNTPSPPKLEVTVHIPWCLICGKADVLLPCTDCAASFHQQCRKEWLNTIIHRKKAPEKTFQSVVMVQKIMSSTRTISSTLTEEENIGLCPSCQWGPKVGYDDVVWHKLGSCPWWPARVLTPGEVPACLRARSHSPHEWPLKYYGTLNHGWGTPCRMCMFLPSHTAQLEAREEALRDAVMDASDDYISVYLT